MSQKTQFHASSSLNSFFHQTLDDSKKKPSNLQQKTNEIAQTSIAYNHFNHKPSPFSSIYTPIVTQQENRNNFRQALYPLNNTPCTSIYLTPLPPKILPEESLNAIQIKQKIRILTEKIFITYQGKNKFQPFPDILGNLTVKKFFNRFQNNLFNRFQNTFYPAFKSPFINDIRILGSGANAIIFEHPKIENLRDIDIVIYLNYIPENPENNKIFLADIASVFIKTLIPYINYPLNSFTDYLSDEPRSFIDPSLINNYFKSKKKFSEFNLDRLDYQRNLQILKNLSLD
jgi:hypothetical protein